MTRRQLLALAGANLPLWGAPRTYSLGSGPAASAPTDARVPFGWKAFSVTGDVPLRFSGTGSRLRLTNAVDSREVKTVEARTSVSNTPLGVFDMRYSYMLQPFELVLDPPLARKAASEGVTLRQTSGDNPAWFLLDGAPAPLRPHLLSKPRSAPLAEFHLRLKGTESVQPFGWMEGCVLDALDDLGHVDALDAHLRLFLPNDEDLIYEDPRSRPSDNKIHNIEETLSFAVIARHRHRHRSLETAVAFWQAGRDADDCVVTGGLTSGEGSYTVAWPMAVVARTRRDKALEDLSLRQLRVRRDRLVTPDGLFLRRDAKGNHTFCNWSRGVAWYSLGLARSVRLLRDRDDIADLRTELERLVRWVLPMQRPDGLWNCFLHQPETGAETSGSAGIATAVAIAASMGLAPEGVEAHLRRAEKGLTSSLTPDGFLGGVTQSNRGGEALQRSGYRVLSQMGMGLFGQLIAARRKSTRLRH